MSDREIFNAGNEKHAAIINYCNERKDTAYDHYLKHHKVKWDIYEKLWSSEWCEGLKTREDEESKIIVPTTQVAVDTATALMDSLVGFEDFFAIDPIKSPDMSWEDESNLAKVFDNMIVNFKDDLKDSNSRGAISESILCAGLYDIGFIKVVTENKEERKIVPGKDGIGVDVAISDRAISKLVNVSPKQLWFEPAATTIEDAEYVIEGAKLLMSTINGRILRNEWSGVEFKADEDGLVDIFEFHGLIPKTLMVDVELSVAAAVEGANTLASIAINTEANIDANDVVEMVEAVVIWADGSSAPFYAKETPFIDGRKSYSAFKWDMNPNCMIGKGIASKAFNVQVAQDSAIRARTDLLSYALNPIVLESTTANIQSGSRTMRRGSALKVKGDVRAALSVFTFPDVPASAFAQSDELNKMAGDATGLNVFSGVDPKFQSAAGMGILQESSINRNRRTLENLDAFLTRALELFLWRGVQFDTDRYPPIISGFKVSVLLGSLTKQMEQSQAAALMKTLPANSAPYWRLLVNYFELGDMPNKEEILRDVRAMAVSAMEPPTEIQPTIKEELDIRKQDFLEKLKTEELRLRELRDSSLAKYNDAIAMAQLSISQSNADRAEMNEIKIKADATLKLAKAESEEMGTQLAEYKVMVEALKQCGDMHETKQYGIHDESDNKPSTIIPSINETE